MPLNEKQVEALTAPLNRAHVKQRSQAGRALSYIEGWHAIAEANRIFGFDAWSRQTTKMRQLHEPYQNEKGNWVVSYSAHVKIIVHGAIMDENEHPVIRDGSGFGSGIDRDIGRAHESAIKEAETDAMKRALMTFGNPFGLALYDKEQANVTDGKTVEPKPTSGNGQKFGGPLTLTDLKKKMREFAGDLAACEEYDQLVALLNTSQPVLDQCMRDLPSWFYGDETQPGAQQRIEEAQRVLAPDHVDAAGHALHPTDAG